MSDDIACFVRAEVFFAKDKAEQKIWQRLIELQARKKKEPELVVGVLGCMAERLKERLLERADMVVGPDAYRTLPHVLKLVANKKQAMNTMLSFDETYADIAPVRRGDNKVSAYVSIMRGCDNMCSFCIVPHTRGRERSRPVGSILEEVEQLSREGYREVVLLGQNVNAYNDGSEGRTEEELRLTPGFGSLAKMRARGKEAWRCCGH